MKKVSKESRVDDLMVDVVEYAFTEWLIRRQLYMAFKANFRAAFPPRASFRCRLRAYIRRSLSRPDLAPCDLISSAFVFIFTPEGVDFWMKESAAWARFYSKFQTNR